MSQSDMQLMYSVQSLGSRVLSMQLADAQQKTQLCCMSSEWHKARKRSRDSAFVARPKSKLVPRWRYAILVVTQFWSYVVNLTSIVRHRVHE